jgi:hypothetical protein
MEMIAIEVIEIVWLAWSSEHCVFCIGMKEC